MRLSPSFRRAVGAAVATLLLAPAAAAAAASAPADCDDLIVTFTRDRVTGDERAVALTAQSIERGAAGWEMVAWDIAQGTQLSAVIATDRAGVVSHLAPDDAGVAEQVTSLTFCGLTSAASDAGDEDDDRTDVTGSDAATGAPDADGADDDNSNSTTAVGADDGTVAVGDRADDLDDSDVGRSVDDGAERTGDVADAGAAGREVEGADAEVDTATADATDAPSRGGATDGANDEGDADDRASSDDDAAPASTANTADTAGTEIDVDRFGMRRDHASSRTGAAGDHAEVDGPAEAGDDTEVLGVRMAATDADSSLGLLNSVWLLIAAIAAGIAAGVGAVRHRTDAAVITDTSVSHPAGRDHGDAVPHGEEVL